MAQTGRAYARERPDPDPRPYAFLCDVTAQLLRLFAAHLDLLGRTGEADAAEELSVRVLSLGLAISEHGTSEEALGVMDRPAPRGGLKRWTYHRYSHRST
ncbi:MAG: hypothetical protein QXP81_06415 [Nitrososphaerota archaeon]